MAQPYVIAPSQGSAQEDEWVRLGVEAQITGKLPDAQRYYQHALRLNPRHAVATMDLAIVFAQSNFMNEALLTIERAVIFGPQFGLIHVNHALMCLEAERSDDALVAAKLAVSMTQKKDNEAEKQAFITSRTAMAMALTNCGRPEEAIKFYDEILKVDPKHPIACPNTCFIQTLTRVTPADLLHNRKLWYEANKYKGEKKPHTNDYSDRPLKVGYVGGDFKTHSAAMIFSNVLLNHDRSRIDPYLYSTLSVNKDSDPMTQKFMACGTWRDISTLNDDQIESTIREDKIDVLVDLAAHTNGGRLSIFTRKPAPIQVTAWGFAHGTGVPEIDYFFADPIAVPETERLHYAERIYDLPCIVTYRPPDYDLKGTSVLPYFQNDFITFGNCARFEKVSDQCLATYAKILRKVKNSRLKFMDAAYRKPASIKRVMAAMPDIDPERLLFSIQTPHHEHLLTYQSVDLILDPFPHTGGLVCLEELYMGIPICTLYGTQPAGRTTSSVLTVMDRTDWIARTKEEYIETAVRMANDIPMLKAERLKLREDFLNSSVVKGYVDAVEEAYRIMFYGEHKVKLHAVA